MHQTGIKVVAIATFLTLIFITLFSGPTKAATVTNRNDTTTESAQAAISATLKFVEIGRYTTTLGTEISAYDEKSKRLFVTGDVLQIIDLSNPAKPTLGTTACLIFVKVSRSSSASSRRAAA